MALRFYNTLARKIEDFTPKVAGTVNMYSCGPTVYSNAHIGNFRTNLMVDLIRRYLEYSGYTVNHVMNITDVGHLTEDDIGEGEDKMQVAAERENKTIWEIAEHYTDLFFKDSDRLNIRKAHHYPKATAHIPEMIEQIQQLIDNGHAYEVNGEVYYDISTFADYGKLSNNKLEELNSGHRIAVNESKRNPADFALWKTDSKHLMQWDSPWSRGFPGWHIECTAMSTKYLGEQLDIHTGGEDNIFPHHECEIAQAEGVGNKPYVRYWIHARHLLVDNKKMSKRDGNFYTLQDLLDKGYSARGFRYLLMTTSFLQNLNFTLESLTAAEEAVKKFDDFIFSMQHANGSPHDVNDLLANAKQAFSDHMDDNLNSAGAVSIIFDMMRETNKLGVDADTAQQVLAQLKSFDEVFGFIFNIEATADGISAEEEAMIKERDQARADKNWARSDEIRDYFAAKNITLIDSADGTLWKRD